MISNNLFRLVLVVSVSLAAKAISADERPNIILLMADDLGWGDLRCFWDESPIETPNLSAMAKNGLKFNRFYAAAPVCSPTRGSCLTGRHPNRYGVFFANAGMLKPEEICLAEVLREHGYTTGLFGKWHLGTLTKNMRDANRGGPENAEFFSPPQSSGFDICFCTESKVPTFDPMLKPKPKSDATGWPFIEDKSKAFAYGTRYWDQHGIVADQNLDGDDSKVIMDRVIPFITEATNQRKPFFSVVWFHAPHLPVVAGPNRSAQYEKHDLFQRNYYGCISAMDEQIGRLRRTLRDLDIDEDTMIWFCSDNGPEGNKRSSPGSAGPFRGRKRSLYEGGIRVCGLLEWPRRIKTKQTTDFPSVTSDYFPTILEALNIPMPKGRPFDGVSLMPVIGGNTKTRNKSICFQSRDQCAISCERFKLYSDDAGKTWELYDLLKDQSETTDLAVMHPEIVRKLREEFFDWQATCAASIQGNDYR